MLSTKAILMFLMFIAGGLAASQAALNSQLSNYISSPIQASFISFCIGALALGLLLIGSQQGMPSLDSFRHMPPHYLLGGLCGAVFITCVILLVPRIGIVNVLFVSLAGQMIVSILIDTFGLFGVKPQQFDIAKIIGLLLIISGVICLNFSGATVNKNKSDQLSASDLDVNVETISSQLVRRMNRKKSRFEHNYIWNPNTSKYSKKTQRKRIKRRNKKVSLNT